MKLKIITILILSFVLIELNVFAQQEKLIVHVNQLKDTAITELKNENYILAESYISKAVYLAIQTEDNSLKAGCLDISGLVFSKLNNDSRALESFLRSGYLYEKIGDRSSQSKLYFKIAEIYYRNKAFKKSIEYFNKSYLTDKVTNSRYPRSYDILKNLGDAYNNMGEQDSAYVFYTEMQDYAKKNKDTLRIIESIYKQTDIHKQKLEYKEAVNKNQTLYNLYKSNHNPLGQAVTKSNIGYLYVVMSDNDKALQSFLNADIISQKNNLGNKFNATNLMNIGICLQNRGDYEGAISSLRKARDLCEEEVRERAVINNILALIYYQKNDLYNATEYSLESIEDALKSDDRDILKNCYNTYSTILQALDDYQLAMNYYKKHLAIRDSLLVERRMKEQKIAGNINDLERFEKDIDLKLADEEVKDMLIKQMKLETEKKEKELELLNKEKELARSEKEKALQTLILERKQRETLIQDQQIKGLEHEKEVKDLILKSKEIEEKEKQKEILLLEIRNEKNKLTIEKQNEVKKRFIWTFGFVLIILSLIIYSLFSARNKNKRLKAQKKQIEQSNDELNQQNEEISAQKEHLESANTKISAQNIEITDSIKYAQRIQEAVVPPFDPKIAGMLSDSFIFYKPKDIVSGDFYWMKRIGENIVIAIADCTGHGVPGAFMSMLGVSYLNEVVSKTRFDNAGFILDRLKRKVIKTLGQTGKEFEQKDGMDMVLIIIDTENMSLQFAGANNPLIIISKGKENLIKGDRMPIGIHHTDTNFTNHQIKISKGDVIYAYSDGFQDQFGGKEGRKFMTKRFKELLYEIHEKEMIEQYQILDDTLKKWQSFKDEEGNRFEQIDDILIMGVRI